jgi:DNA-binding transcriptional LysR family regulator
VDIRQLQRIDLNLLVALQTLLEERSVSRAAQRLHITQPAMSKTLARLREAFDDALFTRSQGGMQPTPRAQELEPSLATILTDIGHLVAGADFDPRAYSGETVISASEYIGLLPFLIQCLHEEAPRLSIRTITRVENQLEQLASGNIDFAIHLSLEHYPGEFRVQRLHGSPPAILVREGHPLSRGEVTWESLAEYPVIRLYVSDLDEAQLVRTSEAYNRMQHRHQGSLETSHLMTAVEVLRNTDYFLPGPLHMILHDTARRGIVTLPFPEDGLEDIQYSLVMHQRCAHSPVHEWLWSQILASHDQLVKTVCGNSPSTTAPTDLS